MGAGEPFGYKMAWAAVPTTDTQRVIQAFSLADPIEVSWKEGVAAAYLNYAVCGKSCPHAKGYGDAHRVFVTPPIGQWTLIVGFDLFGTIRNADEAREVFDYFAQISTEFGEVQYFGTSDIVGWDHWLLARNGEVVRAFGYSLDWKEPFWNTGKPTSAEPFDFQGFLQGKKGTEDWYPSENSVMEVARGWSIDPTQLDKLGELESEGYICIISSDPSLVWNVQHNRFLQQIKAVKNTVHRPSKESMTEMIKRFFRK